MPLEGKISVKHFLKKNLKPMVEGKTRKYPLYVRLRFENKKTEFKSRYWEYLSEDQDIERLLRVRDGKEKKVGSAVFQETDIPYLSDKDLLDQVFINKLSRELMIVHEIMSFYKRHGVNIITDGNPTSAIDRASQRLIDLVLNKEKGKLMERLLDKGYTSIYKVISWGSSHLDIMQALQQVSSDQKNSTQFHRDILPEFDISSINALLNFRGITEFRIYQWEDETFRTPLKEYLLQSVPKTSAIKFFNLIDSIFGEIKK